MLFVKNIDVGRGEGDLLCKEFDCRYEKANLNYLLTYGHKTEIETFIAPKLTNTTFNLSINKYVRNHPYYSLVWVNDRKLRPGEYSVSAEGFLTLKDRVYKNAKVVVQYMHDNDKQKGIVVHSWSLTQGKDVYQHRIGDEDKILIPSWEPETQFNVFLKPDGVNFPIKLVKDRSFFVMPDDNALCVKLSKMFSYSLGDEVIFTKSYPDFCTFLPIDEHKDIWRAKRR